VESTYLVQCWNDAGALVNNYETLVGSSKELAALRKFLAEKHSHVLITKVTRKRRAAR
jgi:hypothetical protein